MRSVVIVSIALFGLACGGEHKKNQDSATTASATSSAAPKTTSTSSTSKGAASGTSTAATSASAAPGSTGPLGYYAQLEREFEAKEKELEKRCEKFADALEKATANKGNDAKVFVAAIAELNKKLPVGVSKEDADFCSPYFSERPAMFEYRSVGSNVQRLAVAAYDKETMDGPGHKLCPSAKAIPANLSDVTSGPYKPKLSDFDDPGWKCLGFGPKDVKDGLVGQLEYKADGKSFEVIVRRPGPKPTDRVTEYVFTGKVGANNQVEISSGAKSR